MAARADDWLGEILECPAFAVDTATDATGLEDAFLYAKVAVDRAGDLAALEEAGFHVVDVNVTLVRDGAQAAAAAAFDVSPLRPGEEADVLDIAGSCFKYSRFHMDPKLPTAVADRIKREWVASYVAGRRGTELLVARDGERPVGFLAVLADGDDRVIDLVGVASDRQRAGAATALVAGFVNRHRTVARTLRVGTQIVNVPSLRLYAQFGFTINRSAYVLHRHARASR